MSLHKILEAAILAPSGLNCQPWKLVVRNDGIDIYDVPERYTFSLIPEREMLLTHGALFENVMIAARASGFHVAWNLLPEERSSNLILRIKLEKTAPTKEPLYSAISKRVTNRQAFQPIPLSDTQKSSLLNLPADLGTGTIRFVEEEEEKESLARAIVNYERSVYNHPEIRRGILAYFRWTEKEAKQTGNGLYVKSLEVHPLVIPLIRLLANRMLRKAIHNLGIYSSVMNKFTRVFASSPAIGAVISFGSGQSHNFTAGRILERIWLEATRLGLSFQPLGGILGLVHAAMSAGVPEIAPSDAQRFIQEYNQIRKTFDIQSGEIIIILFRIGYSAPPTARSFRMPFDQLVKFES